jgi:hypothetical protein
MQLFLREQQGILPSQTLAQVVAASTSTHVEAPAGLCAGVLWGLLVGRVGESWQQGVVTLNFSPVWWSNMK